jgi:hypothetical protein
MAHIPDATVVTASYLLTQYSPHVRSLEETIKYPSNILSIPCYLVIYCNKPLEEHIRTIRESKKLLHLTKIIVQEFEDLWCYSLLEMVKKNRNIYWPTRDSRTSAESHLITCNKADFVLQTIETNPFHTSKFMWMDFSIGENASKISNNYTNHMILSILHQLSDKFHLQLLGVTDKKYKKPENKREYYQEYRWIACGCVFATSSLIGMKILNRIKQLIVHTTLLGYGHGEEMFYLEIMDEFYDDIHRAYGDYKDILHNFITPTNNFVYIYWHLVMKYLSFGYFRECIEVCSVLLAQYDNFQLELNYDLYVRLYFVLYLSYLRMGHSTETSRIAQQIRSYYANHPIFREQCDNLKGLCEMEEFSFSETLQLI